MECGVPVDVLADAQLMDAQCWLWGQDIRRPDGNLLIEYGLRRDRWEGGGHATYYWQERHNVSVLLWSGGILVADTEATIAIPRHGFEVRRWPRRGLANTFPDPRSDDGGGSDLTAEAQEVARGYRWIAEYEAWVDRHTAGRWRLTCAEQWSAVEHEAARLAAEVGVSYDPLPSIPVGELPTRWLAMAERAALR